MSQQIHIPPCSYHFGLLGRFHSLFFNSEQWLLNPFLSKHTLTSAAPTSAIPTLVIPTSATLISVVPTSVIPLEQFQYSI